MPENNEKEPQYKSILSDDDGTAPRPIRKKQRDPMAEVRREIEEQQLQQREKAELLNGKIVDIDPYFGVISDNNGIEAIGGIMGGAHAAVSDDTVNIFIESAFWWPVSIQGRCRKLNFSTDAAYRFERCVDFGTTV